MDARLNRRSLAFGVPGLVLQVVGNVIARNPNAGPEAGWGIIIGGTVLLIIGLAFYARAKGHSAAWCLMGFLSLIGLIVLALLPDRRK